MATQTVQITFQQQKKRLNQINEFLNEFQDNASNKVTFELSILGMVKSDLPYVHICTN